MDTKNPTMRNLNSYATKVIKNRCEELFKDFLPPNYIPLVQKNNIGDSEFTTPCATQIYNMCNKKTGWKYETVERVAEAFIKDLKDNENIISEFKMVVQESKKEDKKEGEGKKRKKKNKFLKMYI